jgi:hypothetical protein
MTEPSQGSELSQLVKLGESLYDAEAEVLRLDAELKRAKARRDRIQNLLLPEAMEEIGITEFRTPTSHFKVQEKLVVQPKAADRPLVLQALEEQGAGELIKTKLEVPFNRGEEEAVASVCEALGLLGRDYKQDRSVHPSTLKKHVKDLLSRGEPLNTELFGVRTFQSAVFTSGAPEAPIFDEEEL